MRCINNLVLKKSVVFDSPCKLSTTSSVTNVNPGVRVQHILTPNSAYVDVMSGSLGVTIKSSGGPFSVNIQLSGSPIDLHRAP